MAEYYSTYIKKGDQVIIGDMSLLWMRFASLIDKKGKIEKIDTESTLKATVDDYIYGPSGGGKDKESVHEYKARFNAHALALVHYLMSNDDHIKKMFKYLGLIKLGLSVDQAFSLAFSTTFAEFDRQVTDYINNDSISGNSYRIGKGGIELPEAECRVNRVLQKEVMGELYSKILMLSCDLVGREGQLKMHADLAAIYPGLAEDVLLRRISLDPGNKLQLTNLAGIYAYSGRCREAAEIYEKLMSSHGDYTWLLNNYAWFLVTATDGELRNTAKAVELAERAVSQKKSSDNLATLAEVYFAGGLLQKAVNTAKEAVLLEKDNDYLKGLLEKYNSALKK
jgi:tetratricopeptide (TPR) repeat protein